MIAHPRALKVMHLSMSSWLEGGGGGGERRGIGQGLDRLLCPGGRHLNYLAVWEGGRDI